MKSNDLRFGLIGCGLWGSHHARSIAKTSGATLVAIAERSAENREVASKEHVGVDIVDDYHQLLERDDIDIVDIVVPSHLHFEIAKKALEADKHLFLEKPMVLRVDHADELIALAKDKGKILAVDHEMRLSSLWGRVRQLIDEGIVGQPQYVLLELSRFPYRLGSEGWRFDINRVGNWILEEPIHFFDLARWYLADFGKPESVYARANSRQPDHPELQDNFTTIMNFTGGSFAVITQTLAAFEHHVTCKVSGTKGSIWAQWSGADARSSQPSFSLRYSDGDALTEVEFDAVTGEVAELEQQIAGIVRSVREGTAPAISGTDGRWSVVMCLAAQRSVDLGRPVKIEEVVPSTA